MQWLSGPSARWLDRGEMNGFNGPSQPQGHQHGAPEITARGLKVEDPARHEG